MTAYIYLRTNDRLARYADDSIEAQRRSCKTAAKRYGYQIIGEFSDTGSGSGPMLARPGLRALMATLKSAPVDLVVVRSAYILSPQIRSFGTLQREVAMHGARLITTWSRP